MTIHIEPFEGRDLDRLITIVLNLTGVVARVIQHAQSTSCGDGIEIIGEAAEQLRIPFGVLAEHHGDEEIALVAQILAQATLLTAEDVGLRDIFLGPGAA